MQLATELRVPGVPTWGDTPLAVESTAGTMKAKENSKRKDMNWFPTWSCLQSIQWPLNLVQVSMCKEGRKAGVVGRPPLQALSQGPLQGQSTTSTVAIGMAPGLELSAPLCWVPPGPGQAFFTQEAHSRTGDTNIWELFRPKKKGLKQCPLLLPPFAFA